MSCPKTDHLLKEYFANELSTIAKQEMESHLRSCTACNAELEGLLLIKGSLTSWQDQRVPHWDRGVELFQREHKTEATFKSGFDFWRWMPTAASFAMLLLVVLNTNLLIENGSVSVSFGGESLDSGLEGRLVAFQENQRAELDDFVTRIENRQDTNNMQLMQVVFDQTQQTTAENLERIYAFFEEQRLQDLEDMRVGYQELIDNDYATVRSIEQLAQYVSFEGEVR